MSDKMQTSGEESDNNKLNSKEKKKDKSGVDKEESNCSTVNQLCTVTQGRYSASITSNIDPICDMLRTKRKLSEHSQIPTADNISNERDISLGTTSSFEGISNLGNCNTEGPSESNRGHASSSNTKQCGKYGANSGTENKPLEILNPANTLPREMIDGQQNSLNLNSDEYVPLPKPSSLTSSEGKPSKRALLLAISRRDSSSTTNHNPHLKLSSDGSGNIAPGGNFKAEGLNADKEGGNINQCDKHSSNSETENNTSEILNSADILPMKMSDRQQNSLNLNSHECVPLPKLSSPEALTCDKPSNSELLQAISRRDSSRTTNHNPHLKSPFDGAGNLARVGNFKADGFDADKKRSNLKQDKHSANSVTQNKTSEILNSASNLPRKMSDGQQNSLNLNSHKYVPLPELDSPELLTYGDKPSNSKLLQAIGRHDSSSTTNHKPHLKLSSDGAPTLVSRRHSKADGLDEGKEKGDTTQETAEGGLSGDQLVVEEQGHDKIAMAGEDALNYFGTNKNAETKADRSTNNTLFKSRPADEVSCTPKEAANLRHRYKNNSDKRLSDNIDHNKFGCNSKRNTVDPISDENSASMKIDSLQKNIKRSQASNNESSVQRSDATRNKMFGEDASSVTQPLNANSQESVETLNADDLNTRQQDSNNLANKCVELENRVHQLQRDNDRMKKAIEHMTQENDKKKKSLKESQECIARSSTLVDPIIKELENKESFWISLVRFAMGRRLMSNNIVDKIGLVCEYATDITHSIINLTNDLKRKDDRVRNLEGQIRKMEANFKKKAAEQLKITKEAEAQYKKEVEAKKKIEDKFQVLEGDIKKYKQELLKYKGQSEEIESLQKDLRKKNQALKDFESHTYFLQNSLKEAAFQLENFRTDITVTHDELQVAEQHFHQSFGSFEAGVTKHSKVLSIEEVSKKAEQNFIDHALQRIAEIRKGAAQYEPQIKEFEGNRENKTYLDIKEKLRRRIQELDTVESHTRKEILAARKEAIQYVTTLCDDLERKVVNC